MDKNNDELRITITSIILATGLAVIAFTELDEMYKVFAGIPAIIAFLYILAVANGLRFYENERDLIFPVPLFLFSKQAKRVLYNLSVDTYVTSLLAMLTAHLFSDILPERITMLVGAGVMAMLHLVVPKYKERLKKRDDESKN